VPNDAFILDAASIVVEGLAKTKKEIYGNPQERPVVLAPDADGVPEEMRASHRWVLWRLALSGGRWAKLPLRTDGRPASVKDQGTWSSFDQVVAAYASGGFIENPAECPRLQPWG
jgi:hypothetical protein